MLELNKIYCESNLETMAKMPDNFIDLTITSPPYDKLRTYNGYSFDFESVAKELFRVTKKGGIVVWVVGDATIDGSETGTSFRQALYFKEIGFNLHDTMIWAKDAFPFPELNRYYQQFEYMFIFSKGKPNCYNLISDKQNAKFGSKMYKNRNIDGSFFDMHGAKNGKKIGEYGIRGNIWSIDIGKGKSTNDDLAFLHPAIFPEKLVEDHIISWSNENYLIYDCFGGSGTTAKMAHKWKRNWILSEISEEYCNIANKRLDPYLKQQTLF
jgi:site-specific DNA-methyltransferase (adenine-specific)